MEMPGGTLTLSYSGTSLEVGHVTTINESMQKSCTVVPLVSMSVDDTFAVESRSSKTINISFKRNNPDWSMNNSTWITRMSAAMNRWQCRTDGFKLIYEADSDNPYIAEINMNGYVKSFIYRYAAGSPEVIEGSIEFHVGTMYAGSQINPEVEARNQSDFYVSMTDSEGVAAYTLLGNDLDINCIESYSLCGGPESPFEYLTMTVPRNRLSEVAPALTEEDGIVAGRNRVTVSAVGTSSMTVTKCKLSNNKYTITAYCNADRLRGYSLKSPITGTPYYIITQLLNGQYGVSYQGDSLVMEYQTYTGGNLSFAQGRNVWYVLQVAAMCLGCRIFFSNNKAYVVDYRNQSSDVIDDQGNIDLYPESGNISTTVNLVSLGDEGIDTIINKVQMRATVSSLDEDGNPQYTYDEATGVYTPTTEYGVVLYPPENETNASITAYDERTSNVISLEDLRETEAIVVTEEVENPEDPEGDPIEQETEVVPAMAQATLFAKNLIDYRDEPQQSIEYTVKEMHSGSGGPRWAPAYLPVARATRIVDDADDVIITNTSDLDGSIKPQKLCLSIYEMHFPQGTTTYTWGVMASIDLSSSTSQITTALDNS